MNVGKDDGGLFEPQFERKFQSSLHYQITLPDESTNLYAERCFY